MGQWYEDAIAALCMFFAGLILLIPHRIGMSRVNYVIKRYNLPISRAGLLLYKYHNNIELSLTIGTLFGNILNWTVGNKSPDAISILMIIFLSLMLISSIYMFRIYISGGDFGHLNAFYFSLIFLTLFDGFANAFAFALNAAYSSLLSAGIPLSGLLVTLLHYMYKFFSDSFHWDDFDYYVLRLQLILNIIGILVALLLWSILAYLKWDLIPTSSFDLTPLFSGAGAEDHKPDWSPIIMLAISLGTVYAFYPSIAPYSIIDFQYASVIELWILIISAILPFLFAILDLVTKIVDIPNNHALGPSGKIVFAYPSSSTAPTSSSTTCSWGTTNKKTGGVIRNWISPDPTKGFYWLWNLIWICVIFYILCIQIFMSMLHYPDCLLSSFFNNNPYRIVFISVLFNTLREVMQACGFAGAGKQVATPATIGLATETGASCKSDLSTKACPNKYCPNFGETSAQSYSKWNTDPDPKQNVNGSIAATNKLITLFVMMFCVFTGDGYLQHYRRCCRDNWPTTGYNKYQSFFYWLRYGFKGGIKSITSSFTDLYYHNLRPQFISYA